MAKEEGKKNKMMLEVVNPYEVFYEGQVESIVIPTLDGQFGVLPGRAPIVVAVTPGVARFVVNGEEKKFVISEGFAEIGQHVAVVVCNAAEWPEAIDAERAQKALERAQERMHDATATEEQRIYARHAIRRAKARLQIVKENEKKKDQFGL